MKQFPTRRSLPRRNWNVNVVSNGLDANRSEYRPRATAIPTVVDIAQKNSKGKFDRNLLPTYVDEPAADESVDDLRKVQTH